MVLIGVFCQNTQYRPLCSLNNKRFSTGNADREEKNTFQGETVFVGWERGVRRETGKSCRAGGGKEQKTRRGEDNSSRLGGGFNWAFHRGTRNRPLSQKARRGEWIGSSRLGGEV